MRSAREGQAGSNEPKRRSSLSLLSAKALIRSCGKADVAGPMVTPVDRTIVTLYVVSVFMFGSRAPWPTMEPTSDPFPVRTSGSLSALGMEYGRMETGLPGRVLADHPAIFAALERRAPDPITRSA